MFLGKIPIVRYVTEPTLTIFPAAKEKNTGTAVIICPGGAYGFLAYETEGNEVARRFQQLGVSAFVLKYRLPDKQFQQNPAFAPLQDVQQAFRLIRRQACLWGIKSGQVGIIGFSAGGHLASTAGTHFDKPVLSGADSLSVRPDFMVLIYPVISFSDSLTHAGSRANLLGAQLREQQVNYFSNESHVTSQVPPTMLVHCADDLTVSISNSLVFYQACLKAKVEVEMHLYPKGGHGFGLYNPYTADQWMDRVANWLSTQGLIQAVTPSTK
jgi:acetyl esterase/lipase